MNKQTVALIALFAGWILAAEMANATTYKDIVGQWCGDVTDYVASGFCHRPSRTMASSVALRRRTEMD